MPEEIKKSENSDVTESKQPEAISPEEFKKVIAERDSLKQNYEQLNINYSKLNSEFSEFKSQITQKGLEKAEKSGDIEEMRNHFNNQLNQAKEREAAAIQRYEALQNEYVGAKVNSKLQTIANELTGHASHADLFQAYYKNIELKEDKLVVQNDARDIEDIFSEFVEKHKLNANKVKSGMSATAGNAVADFGSEIRKSQIEKMDKKQLQSLAVKNPRLLDQYLAGKLN